MTDQHEPQVSYSWRSGDTRLTVIPVTHAPEAYQDSDESRSLWGRHRLHVLGPNVAHLAMFRTSGDHTEHVSYMKLPRPVLRSLIAKLTEIEESLEDD